jgi:hypothetical protein
MVNQKVSFGHMTHLNLDRSCLGRREFEGFESERIDIETRCKFKSLYPGVIVDNLNRVYRSLFRIKS